VGAKTNTAEGPLTGTGRSILPHVVVVVVVGMLDLWSFGGGRICNIWGAGAKLAGLTGSPVTNAATPEFLKEGREKLRGCCVGCRGHTIGGKLHHSQRVQEKLRDSVDLQ